MSELLLLHDGDESRATLPVAASSSSGSTLKYHVCDFQNCKKMFLKRWSLERHIRTHTGERPYACPYCPYRSKQKHYISIHAKSCSSKLLKTFVDRKNDHNVM